MRGKLSADSCELSAVSSHLSDNRESVALPILPTANWELETARILRAAVSREPNIGETTARRPGRVSSVSTFLPPFPPCLDLRGVSGTLTIFGVPVKAGGKSGTLL